MGGGKKLILAGLQRRLRLWDTRTLPTSLDRLAENAYVGEHVGKKKERRTLPDLWRNGMCRRILTLFLSIPMRRALHLCWCRMAPLRKNKEKSHLHHTNLVRIAYLYGSDMIFFRYTRLPSSWLLRAQHPKNSTAGGEGENYHAAIRNLANSSLGVSISSASRLSGGEERKECLSHHKYSNSSNSRVHLSASRSQSCSQRA